jgi:hypothetical protein
VLSTAVQHGQPDAACLPWDLDLYSADWSQPLFEPSNCPAADILCEPALLFGIGSATFPSWDQRNEAVQSDSRPGRQSDRHKSPRRAHFIHCPAKDIHPPAGGTLSLPLSERRSFMRARARFPLSIGTACRRSTCDA